jgi:uncharacterized cupin superfamily protein
MPVQEASSEETPYGRWITSDGWFVLNLGDALAVRQDAMGAVYPLESREHMFRDFGVNVRILLPGVPNARYHSETGQEGFLVLAGECTLVVEDEERPLRQWDYFHCPGTTAHVFVGAGDGPCAILMTGTRSEDEELHYPVSEVAARYGASATEATDSPEVAYARYEGSRPGRPADWDALPWVEN